MSTKKAGKIVAIRIFNPWETEALADFKRTWRWARVKSGKRAVRFDNEKVYVTMVTVREKEGS